MRSNRRTFILATAGLTAAAYGGRVARVGAQDDAAANLIVFGDIVGTGRNYPEDQQSLRSCVNSSRFPRNSQMVWRMRVIDPKTGEQMDDTMLEKVEVVLSDGQVFAMEYGPHPPEPNPPRDYYWTVPWLVPKDYPTGTLSYTVVATGTDGRSGEFKPFDIPPSLPTITEEVLQDIVEEEEEEEATPT
jgi:hypothetical protein